MSSGVDSTDDGFSDSEDELQMWEQTRADYSGHALVRQLNEACSSGAPLGDVGRLVAAWRSAPEPSSPPRGPRRYPLGPLLPAFHHAVREGRADVAAYLLQQGMKVDRRAVSEAIRHRAPPAMWQAFVDHGLDINAPLGGPDPPPLSFVLDDENLVRWFLAHGADPTIESERGLSPLLRAVAEAPLATVRLLYGAAAAAAAASREQRQRLLGLALPFACSPLPGTASVDRGEAAGARRLAVLRFLLDDVGSDLGVDLDLNARKWAHNARGRASDLDWGSALNYALVYRFGALAEELLRRGARTDVTALNVAAQGETALELARKYVPDLVPLVEECRRREQG